VLHIPPAYCCRCYFKKTYPACELRCARALENAILQEGPENVSAFIADEEIQDSQACVGDVRGLGRMCGVEFVQDKATRAPFPPGLKVAERVMDACLDRGLIVFPGHGTADGAAGDHLLLGPPLVVTAGEVKQMLAILKEGIAAVATSICA
jgi:adenosylmethionine-8-amino-7-oxononanoate aminotransferase